MLEWWNYCRPIFLSKSNVIGAGSIVVKGTGHSCLRRVLLRYLFGTFWLPGQLV